MNNTILKNDGSVVYYVVRVNGQIVSPRFESKVLAEAEKSKLEPEQQNIAEVITVTSDGNQVLLG